MTTSPKFFNYNLQDHIVTLYVIIQITCFGYQMKAGNWTISRMHLTLKTNEMIQFYKQIEFMYNNINQNHYYIVFIDTTMVHLKKVGKGNKHDNESEHKDANYHIFILVIVLTFVVPVVVDTCCC